MFGWSSFALVGLALFVVMRTSKVTLVRLWPAMLGLVLWNLALIAELVTLSLGITQGPQEYSAFVWPVAVLYAPGLGCIATTVISTVANRTMPETYISN
jgi:cytochrome c oxidase cbb3-type subunit I